MLANSWARAGSTVASRCTRSAAEALSAARSRAVVTRVGAGPAERPSALADGRPVGLDGVAVGRRRAWRLDEPGSQLREMLLVLGQQRAERLSGCPRIAVDGRPVQLDQVFFRGNNCLQGQHIVAEGRPAGQRIGAGEQA